MGKTSLSERDICTKCIAPTITSVGCYIQREVREGGCFTRGQVGMRGTHAHLAEALMHTAAQP